MSELQQDATVYDDEMIGQDANREPENTSESDDQATDPASATGDTDKDRAVEFTEEQQRYIEEQIIAKKVFKLREAERKAEQIQKQYDELQKKLPQDSRPSVPDLPDPYSLTDSEFRQKLQERENALRKAAEYDAKQRFAEEQSQQEQLRRQQEQQEALYKEVQSYTQRAVKLGVKPEELQAAGNTVAHFGMDDSIVQMILSDEVGPLITKYLGSNVSELESLRNLPPTLAAVKIATEIRPKAAALKPKTSAAPAPTEPPRQSGYGSKVEVLDGVTFE